MRTRDDADTTAAAVYAANQRRDIAATLTVARPQTAGQWAAWHARRDAVRQCITRIRSDNTETDRDLITRALGLDPDSEAELLARWE